MSLRSRKPPAQDLKPANGVPVSPDTSLTVSWADIPAWMQDNAYILRGYRRELGSFKSCLYSIFGYLHNETMNIHTHLWGAVLFTILLSTLSLPLARHTTLIWIDFVGFAVFLLSAVFCLSASASYHALHCHSKPVSDRLHVWDYIGIVVLIVGSYYPTVYYGFFCDPWPQAAYVLAITIAGLGAAYIVLTPHYAQPSYRWARTTVFLALGLCAIVPVTHALYANGYYRLRHEMGLDWLVWSGALYVVGALIYAARVPERFAPGTFDIFFSSHQIFHMLVVAAALCQYFCVITALNHRHGAGLAGVCPTP